jgi:TolA-binding protein
MNSDKFDRVVLDLLYGELDELTTAAARRHMEQSARARDIFAHLKATRQLGVLPIHTPPPDFEATLMARERHALAELPFVHRVGRIVSMLAGYAMRPQLVMGALLMLMLGSSLMFLRARPGQHSAMQVTERGAPEAELDVVLPLAPAPASPALSNPINFQPSAPASSAPAPSPFQPPGTSPRSAATPEKPMAADPSTAEGLDPFDQAVTLYRAGHYVEAQLHFERISRGGGQRAAEAALYAAQTTRNVSGCAPAVSRFERVRSRFPGSGSAYEAAWRAAKCLQQLGDIEAARQTYQSLLQVAAYADRARQALANLGETAAPATTALPPIAVQEPPTEPSFAASEPPVAEVDSMAPAARDVPSATAPSEAPDDGTPVPAQRATDAGTKNAPGAPSAP